MNLPNANAAVVSEEKISAYLLNPLHPDGAGKAQFFIKMGFRTEDWRIMAAALRQLAEQHPVARSVESFHGRKYIVDGPLGTPCGRTVHVRTIWIIDRGGQTPRLVTAYPREEGA